MYLARISTDAGTEVAARVASGRLVRLGGLGRGQTDDPLALLDELGADELWVEAERLAQTGTALVNEAAAEFHPPVAHCSKIVGVALNYRLHAQEGNFEPPTEPVIFFKPSTTLIGHGQTVVCPTRSARLDYEVELAVVVGRRARDVKPDDWSDVVAGYTILNDVTARDLQLEAIQANVPWDRSKGFDGFAPIGPYLVTPDEIDDPHDLDLEIRIGDRILQSSNTRHMIFGLPELIADITAGMTLEPGDVIATGTPDGIGPAGHGEVMEATIERLGTLRTPVAFAAELEAAGVRL